MFVLIECGGVRKKPSTTVDNLTAVTPSLMLYLTYATFPPCHLITILAIQGLSTRVLRLWLARMLINGIKWLELLFMLQIAFSSVMHCFQLSVFAPVHCMHMTSQWLYVWLLTSHADYAIYQLLYQVQIKPWSCTTIFHDHKP